jgi:hypothetical protein
MTRYIDIGSTEEQLEMLAVQESAKATSLKLSMKHKIYRTLDPRRYSMYFNRWYARNVSSGSLEILIILYCILCMNHLFNAHAISFLQPSGRRSWDHLAPPPKIKYTI